MEGDVGLGRTCICIDMFFLGKGQRGGLAVFQNASISTTIFLLIDNSVTLQTIIQSASLLSQRNVKRETTIDLLRGKTFMTCEQKR